VYNGTDGSFPARSSGDTNFAGIIAADGSVVGMWRGRTGGTGAGGGYQYTAFAADWKDPASYHFGRATVDNNIFKSLGRGQIANCGIEDPTLWMDAAGIIHAVVHNWAGGGHAASSDQGKTWRWYGGNCSSSAGRSSLDWSRSVWPAKVTFNDGSSVAVQQRERPHLVFDEGKLVALSTGFRDVPDSDRTWTLVQATS
jgi:hypothetical protein